MDLERGLEIGEADIATALPNLNEGQVRSGLRGSLHIGALACALAKAQSEFKPVVKDSNNPYFGSKYADLANVIEATRPALSKNGLVVLQSPRVDGEMVVLTTMLMHSSGEWLADQLKVPGKGKAKDGALKFDVQTVGSAITYARRYAYQSFVGVAAEDDDDGNAAASASRSVQMPGRKEPKTEPTTEARRHGEKPQAGVPVLQNQNQKPVLTFAQKFWAAAKNSGKTEEDVRRHLAQEGFESTGEIPVKSQDGFMDWAEGK